MTSVLAYGQPPPQPPPPQAPRQSPPQPPASMSAVQFLSANSSPHSSSELRPLPAHLAGASGATCPVGHPLVPDPCSNQPTCTSCQAITGALVRGQQQSLGLSEGAPTSAFYSRTDPGMSTAAKAEMLRNMAVGPYPTYSTLDPYTVYPYLSSYAGIDARRKNSMKEATNTLKAWLFEHRKNPYPTKGEKIMLAILTKMTLTQVSTWFANARRRLKKENKVTWGSDKEEDDDDDDGDGESLRRHHATDDDKVEDGEDKEHYEDDVREDDAENNDAIDDDDEDDEINIEDEDHPLGQAPSGRPGQSEVSKVTVDTAGGQDAQDGGQQGAVCLKPETVRRATYGAEENGDKSSQLLTGPLTTGQRRPSHEHRLQQRHHHHDDEQMDSGQLRGNGPIVNGNNAGAEPRQQRNTQKPKIWSIADVMGFKDGEQSESRPNNNGESSSRSSSLASASSSASPDHHGGSRNCEVRPGAVVPHPHTRFPQPTAASTSGSVLRSSDNKLYSLGEAQYAAQLIGGVPLNGTATYPALYSQYLQTGISMDGVYPSFLPSAYWRTS